MRYSMLLSLGAGLLAGTLLAGAAPAQSEPANATPDQTTAQQNSNAGSNANSNSSPKKVYTNDDLRAMRGSGGVSVVGNSRQGTKAGQTATSEPKNEQYWRNRARNLRNQMAEVDRQIAQLEAANQNTGSGAGNTNGQNPPPPIAYTVGAHARALSGNPRLQRLEARKAQIQEQMDQLEEDARKAGVPAGWLR